MRLEVISLAGTVNRYEYIKNERFFKRIKINVLGEKEKTTAIEKYADCLHAVF